MQNPIFLFQEMRELPIKFAENEIDARPFWLTFVSTKTTTMKYILAITTLFVFSNLEAQLITRKNGNTGLLDANGNQLLPCIYDGISQVEQFNNFTSLYILRDNGKCGLYCSDSKQKTECVYGKIYERNGLVMIESDTLFGFVAQPDDSSYSIVEPVYSYVGPMSGGFNYGEIKSLGDHPISVRKDSLWGVLSSADGTERLPCKYPYSIQMSIYDPFWVMKYPDSYDELLINPKTGATFESTMDCKQYYNYSNNTLLIYSTIPYEGNTRIPLQVNLYNFSSGYLIWNYSSSADHIQVDIIDDEIVMVEESSGDEDINRNDGKKVYSFYNITNSALLLKYEGGEESRVDIYLQDNKYTVYASRTYNGRKQEIGVIFR